MGKNRRPPWIASPWAPALSLARHRLDREAAFRPSRQRRAGLDGSVGLQAVCGVVAGSIRRGPAQLRLVVVFSPSAGHTGFVAPGSEPLDQPWRAAPAQRSVLGTPRQGRSPHSLTGGEGNLPSTTSSSLRIKQLGLRLIISPWFLTTKLKPP